MNNTTEPLSTQAQEHIEMLEAEMESLRRRMKLLETRVAEFDTKPSSAANFSPQNDGRATTAGVPKQEQPPTGAAGISSPAHSSSASPPNAHSPVSKRRRSSTSRKTDHSHSQRSAT
ncbi:MAG: hypothetical protein ACU84Q_10865, partial [Gammaproteobacteria bacterium]